MVITVFRSRVKPVAQEEYAQRAWAVQPEQIEAQKTGRKDFYREYRAQVCTVQRESAYPTTETATMRNTALKQADPSANDLETLRELNLNYIRSVRESDVRWFDDNLAADFMNSNPDGSLVDRAAFLKQIAPPCPISNLEVEDVRIRILGETAIIHARTTYRKPGGHAGVGRYTDVWSRRQGRWLCVSAHVSRG